MNFLQALFLGVVQGLTEFLPVSSSGHLVLIKGLIQSFNQPGVLFEVILHLGTLFAVFVYFKDKIIKVDKKYLKLLVVGTIPAGAAGVLFRKVFEGSFSSYGIFLGVQFLITSGLCFATDRLKPKHKDISLADSFLIGLGQAVAILPAISRSAATIFVAGLRGINKKTAAEFSFLLSIPAIVGANLVEVVSYPGIIGEFDSSYLVGFIAALVIGYLSISLTINLLIRERFAVFGIYTFILGILSIVV